MPAFPPNGLAQARPMPSLRLSERTDDPAGDTAILSGLSEAERSIILAAGSVRHHAPGTMVFRQGDSHDGIFIILAGQVRSFYIGPSGREITLAYWSPGNFVGGPDIFGTGPHLWSGQAERPSQTLHLPGAPLRRLMETIPRLAFGLVDALVAKGKAYSALIHMLGTRSAAQRLAQLLVLMADLDPAPVPDDGVMPGGGVMIARALSREDLAKMVGATRQWVTASLDRFRDQGLLATRRGRIILTDIDGLRAFAG